MIFTFLITFVLFLFFFFFFQAEDGIRDYKVTGVQTCALPISCTLRRSACHRGAAGRGYVAYGRRPGAKGGDDAAWHRHHSRWPGPVVDRSEERRVGKECRSRWGADH